MDLTEIAQILGSFGEFFGAIAVVITLIYLAIQVKHSARASQVAAAQSFAIADNGFVGVINLSDNLADVIYRGSPGLSKLSGEDQIRFNAFNDQVIVSAQAAYLQWRAGTLDSRLWGTMKQAVIDILSQPGQQEWWELRKHWFDDEFCEYVEESIKNGNAKLMHPAAFKS